MPNPSPIRAITFDVGGTLIEPWPSVGHIYAQAAQNHGAGNISPELLKRRFVSAWQARRQFRHTRREWAELVDETFQGITQLPPSSTFFPELYEYFGRGRAWRLFEDVLPVLERLVGRGVPLGIISNWDDRLRPLLHELGLSRYFGTVVISCEAGVCKPNQKIFESATQQLGIPAHAILHVGDSAPHDLDGARAAGFQALLLDRGLHNRKPDTIHSLAHVCSLTDGTFDRDVHHH